MTPEQMRAIGLYISNPGDPRFGPGATYPIPSQEDIDAYTRQVSSYPSPGGGPMNAQDMGAPAAPAAAGGMSPPPAPIPVGASGVDPVPASVNAGASPVVDPAFDPSLISPMTGMPRSVMSQRRRADHDVFMGGMADYLGGAGPRPTMGPRPVMPGQPAPPPDFPMGPMPMDANGMPRRSGFSEPFPARSVPGQSFRPQEPSYSGPPTPMPVSAMPSSGSSDPRYRSMPRTTRSPIY